MIYPKAQWVAVAPGVMELPHTKMQIKYKAGSFIPFRVMHDGIIIPDGFHTYLEAAQRAGEAHMSELLTMGFES